MNEQEIANALRICWSDIDEVDRDILGDRLLDLLVDNPPWNPGQGDPCWLDTGGGQFTEVEYHDEVDYSDEVSVWFCDHRHDACQIVQFKNLSPRTEGDQP